MLISTNEDNMIIYSRSLIIGNNYFMLSRLQDDSIFCFLLEFSISSICFFLNGEDFILEFINHNSNSLTIVCYK